MFAIGVGLCCCGRDICCDRVKQARAQRTHTHTQCVWVDRNGSIKIVISVSVPMFRFSVRAAVMYHVSCNRIVTLQHQLLVSRLEATIEPRCISTWSGLYACTVEATAEAGDVCGRDKCPVGWQASRPAGWLAPGRAALDRRLVQGKNRV